MSFWKYKQKDGDSDFFYILVIPFIPFIMIFTFYFELIRSKFRTSQTVVKKLLFPVFIFLAVLPCFAIPALTVITLDAWIVKYSAHERYIDNLSRDYFVVQNPNEYYSTKEITKEMLPYYKSSGYVILDDDKSEDWYANNKSWNAGFANPLYLLGWALGLNIPLLFAFLVESWLAWVFRKDPKEQQEQLDKAS